MQGDVIPELVGYGNFKERFIYRFATQDMGKDIHGHEDELSVEFKEEAVERFEVDTLFWCCSW